MEDFSMGTSPSPHRQVAMERKSDAHSLRGASRCYQLLAGLSGCHRIEWRLKPSAFQDPHVPQPLLPLGCLHGNGGGAAALSSLALTSLAPQPGTACVPLTGLAYNWLKAQYLSAASLRCCPSSALVQDFKALCTHPVLFCSFSHPGNRAWFFRAQELVP